jgi:hypothetical protein
MENKPRLTIRGIPTREVAIVLSALMDESYNFYEVLLHGDELRRLEYIAESDVELESGTGVGPRLTNLIEARLKQIIRNIDDEDE